LGQVGGRVPPDPRGYATVSLSYKFSTESLMTVSVTRLEINGLTSRSVDSSPRTDKGLSPQEMIREDTLPTLSTGMCTIRHVCII